MRSSNADGFILICFVLFQSIQKETSYYFLLTHIIGYNGTNETEAF